MRSEHPLGREVVGEVWSNRVVMGDTKMVRLQTTFHQDFPVRTSFRRFFGSDPVIGKAKPTEVPV